jgi:hypothetical protein
VSGGGGNDDGVELTDANLVALCPRLTVVSLNLPTDLKVQGWEEIGAGLARVERSLQWYVGDWWVWAQDRNIPPQVTHTIAGQLGFAPQTCMNYASVARAFQETSRRRELLSFGHHEAVVGLGKEKADEFLAWAEEPVADGLHPRRIRELRDKRDREIVRTPPRGFDPVPMMITLPPYRLGTNKLVDDLDEVERKLKESMAGLLGRPQHPKEGRPNELPSDARLVLDTSGAYGPVPDALKSRPSPNRNSTVWPSPAPRSWRSICHSCSDWPYLSGNVSKIWSADGDRTRRHRRLHHRLP